MTKEIYRKKESIGGMLKVIIKERSRIGTIGESLHLFQKDKAERERGEAELTNGKDMGLEHFKFNPQ